MNYQSKGLQFSLIIHAAMFAVIIVLSSSITPINKPVVIDFNINDSAHAPKENLKEAPAKAKPLVKSRITEAKEQKKEIEKTAPVADTHLAPITEAQVPVPAPLQPKQDGFKAEGQSTVVNKTVGASGSGVGTKIDAGSASVAGTGDSVQRLKTKYLKEHFTYIRDIIMKNLSYPHMARKMGWSGKVLVSFVVFETGNAEDIKVVESSGFVALDRNTIETIKKVSPFPKPPVRAELIMPVVYRLE